MDQANLYRILDSQEVTAPTLGTPAIGVLLDAPAAAGSADVADTSAMPLADALILDSAASNIGALASLLDQQSLAAAM
jgi:hypothetical protein